jgi:hypothetical protein
MLPPVKLHDPPSTAAGCPLQGRKHFCNPVRSWLLAALIGHEYALPDLLYGRAGQLMLHVLEESTGLAQVPKSSALAGSVARALQEFCVHTMPPEMREPSLHW